MLSETISAAIIGGIFGSVIVYFLEKRKQKFISELEHKQKRYMNTIGFMIIYLNSNL